MRSLPTDFFEIIIITIAKVYKALNVLSALSIFTHLILIT